MDSLLGSSLAAFIVITLIVFGTCSFLAGQALAEAWKPHGAVLGYTLLMGVGDRFLVYALFGGSLLSLYGFIVHTLVIWVILEASYRMARARRMVTQYPWLYDRAGPFGWRDRPGAQA